MFRRFSVRLIPAVAILLLPVSRSLATWSIVIANKETKEVAVGTTTCLTTFDLLNLVPVVVVGKGAAAVQSAGDFDGLRRPIIFDGLINGTSPEDLLAFLAANIPDHEQRQYGIADTLGRKVTFSGTFNGSWAGGVTSADSPLTYAIQGNVLAGPCVLQGIEEAVRTTVGDIPAKLMAGMQAARAGGGDGRCSCHPIFANSCTCPPPDFTKVGHIGGMVVARIGDIDDAVCNASGCANGDYFMRLNVSFQTIGDIDPVIQLQDQFDTWRLAHNGRPDAIQSAVTFDNDSIPPNGASTTTMNITLRDWSGGPITSAISSVVVVHAADSDGISTIGSVVDQGGGVFSVVLTAGASPGTDRFTITVDDGIRPVVLMPEPLLAVCTLGGSCDDNNPCTESDTCSATGCAGTPIAGVAASIVTAPVDTEVCSADDTTFTVAATGSPTPVFQWRKDRVNIRDATGSSYTVVAATDDDAGVYTVSVTNDCGDVLSAPAVLTIVDPLTCVDGNPCTIDSCSGGCVFVPDVGASCDDGNSCTSNDQCDALGGCAGSPFCELHGDVFPFVEGAPNANAVGNCVVDLDDLLTVLASFSATIQCGPDFPNGVNTFPCGEACPGGVIDIDDILSTLSAFSSEFDCPHPCPGGACCLGDSSCQDWDGVAPGTTPPGGMFESACLGLSGLYQGDGTTCADVSCP